MKADRSTLELMEALRVQIEDAEMDAEELTALFGDLEQDVRFARLQYALAKAVPSGKRREVSA